MRREAEEEVGRSDRGERRKKREIERDNGRGKDKIILKKRRKEFGDTDIGKGKKMREKEM